MDNEKKVKTLVKKTAKAKRDLIFAGAQSLMNRPNNEKEAQERRLIVLTSKAAKVSPMGVVLLGGLPYFNNQARKEKLAQYNGYAQYRYEWVHVATDDVEKAICKAKLVVYDKTTKQFVDLCDFIIGECSPASMRMGTLKGYQNHMAQTRAENRAFEAAFGTRFRTEFYQGIENEMNAGRVDADTAQKALNAGKVSAEEATVIKPTVQVASPFNLALKAIEQQKTVSGLEMFRGRILGGTQMSDADKAELIKKIDEKIKALRK